MAKLVKVKGTFGHDYTIKVERIDAIVYQLDGNAVVYVGRTELSVTHETARNLEKIIDSPS